MRASILFFIAFIIVAPAHAADVPAGAMSPNPASSLNASQPAPLPPGPLLAKMPDVAAWTITIDVASPDQNAKSSIPAPDQIKASLVKVAVVKSNKIFLTEITVESSVKIWSVGRYNIETSKLGVPPLVFVGSMNNGFNLPDYEKNDFSGLDWINSSNYTGVATVEGKQCLVFKGKVSSNLRWGTVMGPGQKFDEIPAEADIDVQTRLPVELRLGAETRVFSFDSSGVSTLSVPADVQKAIAQLESRLKDASKMPARP